jgi:hypothetical protein
MIQQNECPWCVQVTCLNTAGHPGGRMLWSSYRPRADAHKPCPWCDTTVGPFKITAVHHRLSTICPRRKFARGAGPS